MPIIYRITTDMFEMSEVVDFFCNPCNLVGVAGAGLSLEFRRRVPQFIEAYRTDCRTGDLRIGTITIFEDTDYDWGIINLPTKRHYTDLSNIEDIRRGLAALRGMLLEDKYRYSTICLPMLGCGLGKQNYDDVLPSMQEFLSDLDATVFISMAPDKTELEPKYLVVAGPPGYGNTREEQTAIDRAIFETLQNWDQKITDYTAVVSGGFKGVDQYIAGEHYLKDVENTYAYQQAQDPIVIKPNTPRLGISAALYLGNLLVEIADDLILFKPEGCNNNRLSAMQTRMEVDNQDKHQNGLIPKRMMVIGEASVEPIPQTVLIPEENDVSNSGLINQEDIPF